MVADEPEVSVHCVSALPGSLGAKAMLPSFLLQNSLALA